MNNLSIQGEVSIDSSEPVLEELEPQMTAEPVQLEAAVAVTESREPTPGRNSISLVDLDPTLVKRNELKRKYKEENKRKKEKKRKKISISLWGGGTI